MILHENQSYLGRAICYLNQYKEDMAELSREEYLELLKIIKRYQKVLTKLWQPDWWNYARQGNCEPRLHFHFVPRYQKARAFEEKKFTDRRWGKNYVPALKRKIDKKVNQKIKLAIKAELG